MKLKNVISVILFLIIVAVFYSLTFNSIKNSYKFYDAESNEIPYSTVTKLVRSQFTKVSKEDSAELRHYFYFYDSTINRIDGYYIDLPEEWQAVDSTDNMRMYKVNDTFRIEFNNPKNK